MTLPLAFLHEFRDAIDLIFHSRESRSGGSQIGGTQFLELTAKHMELTLAAMAAACLVAIPLGLWLGHARRGQFVAVSVSNIGRAVPSLALIALFVAFVGVGFSNVTAALALLAIPPILANTYVGVTQVDPDAVDAARGMGMTGLGVVRRTELPLAAPLIFAGVKTSAVNVVATATIAPLAGVSTLGDPIINFGSYGDAGRLGASIVVAALAVATELSLSAVQRVATPKGLKLASRGSASRWRFPATTRRRVRVTP